jgi:hypothetical protein
MHQRDWIGEHLAFIGYGVVGAVEVNVDRLDDGKCAMSSPRALLGSPYHLQVCC